MQFDVFNGDADGLCALVQLRLAEPLPATLVTGVKRDIQLLERVVAQAGDTVTVLDISLKQNKGALERLLAQGVEVFYVDHHEAGDIPSHPNFTALINTAATTCTSLLVDGYLQGKYRAWAVTAAFGDNLLNSARNVAETLSLSEQQLKQLHDLGVCINYNGYGSQLEDLHFPPDVLFRELSPYPSPFDFIADNAVIHQQLLSGYGEDMAKALHIQPEYQTAETAVFLLPDAAWARRVSGVFGNELANQNPTRAHAILSYNAKGGYQISVRAPLTNPAGADELCSAFATGGGRKSAAGINHLPVDQLSVFIGAFANQYA